MSKSPALHQCAPHTNYQPLQRPKYPILLPNLPGMVPFERYRAIDLNPPACEIVYTDLIFWNSIEWFPALGIPRR